MAENISDYWLRHEPVTETSRPSIESEPKSLLRRLGEKGLNIVKIIFNNEKDK